MKSCRGLATAILALALPLSTLAAEGGGFYLAAGLGDADVDEDTGGLSVDDSDTGFHATLGFNLLPWLAVEGGVVDFGEFDASAPGLSGEAEVDGFTLGVMSDYEFGPHWFVQGRLGLFEWDAEASAVAGANAIQVDDDGADAYYGVGVRWDFEEHWGASADWTRYQADDLDVDYLSVSVIWRFDF